MSNAAYRTVKLHDVGDSAETSTRQPPPNLTRTTTNIVPLIRAAIINAIPKVNAGVRTRTFRQHAGAILTLFIFGLLPLTVYFRVVNTPFVAQPVSCGSIKEEAPGITGLFTIDRVPGNFPFWLAKLLDTIWDLFVARGLQFLAWCISYTIFSSALLRTIKASPIPYRTFIGISMNGASLLTIVSLLADLGRYSRKRTVWLFAYGALALTYVLAIPTLFSTMTGYVSVASPYIKLPVNSLFIPADAFEYGITFYYLPGVANASCVTTASLQVANQRIFSEAYDCKLRASRTWRVFIPTDSRLGNSTCTGLSGTPSAEARAYLLSQLERNPRRSAALYDDATCTHPLLCSHLPCLVGLTLLQARASATKATPCASTTTTTTPPTRRHTSRHSTVRFAHSPPNSRLTPRHAPRQRHQHHYNRRPQLQLRHRPQIRPGLTPLGPHRIQVLQRHRLPGRRAVGRSALPARRRQHVSMGLLLPPVLNCGHRACRVGAVDICHLVGRRGVERACARGISVNAVARHVCGGGGCGDDDGVGRERVAGG